MYWKYSCACDFARAKKMRFQQTNKQKKSMNDKIIANVIV